MPTQFSTNGKITEEPQRLRRFERSGMVQEIVSNKPGLLIRYGISIFLLVLVLVGILAWFIKYPDIISTHALLTSINSPKPVIALQNGKLIAFSVKENDSVKQGQILGKMEALADHEKVLMLSQKLVSLSIALEENNAEKLLSFLNDKTFYQNDAMLGELQTYQQEFSNASLVFKNYLSNGFYIKKKNMLATDMANLKKLNRNLQQQEVMVQQDLALTQKTFDANETLKNDKIISDFEYRLEKSKLINKQMSLPQISASLISNENQQVEKQKEKMELENLIAQQKQVFTQALNTYKSHVAEWEKQYSLIAPIDGIVRFASFMQVNQQVKANEIICYISTGNSEYYAELTIPQSNFGKVKRGQTVLLKFPAYPYQEYGAVKGKIDFISHIPTDSGYKAKVSLSQGLFTSQQKQIVFTEGLKANGEIITKDMRLLERFYYGILNKAGN